MERPGPGLTVGGQSYSAVTPPAVRCPCPLAALPPSLPLGVVGVGRCRGDQEAAEIRGSVGSARRALEQRPVCYRGPGAAVAVRNAADELPRAERRVAGDQRVLSGIASCSPRASPSPKPSAALNEPSGYGLLSLPSSDLWTDFSFCVPVRSAQRIFICD